MDLPKNVGLKALGFTLGDERFRQYKTKSLSVRTHVCSCGYVEDRDTMASLSILKKATIGHIGLGQ